MNYVLLGFIGHSHIIDYKKETKWMHLITKKKVLKLD